MSHTLPPSSEIAAILPEYSSSGDTVMILTRSGIKIPAGLRIKSVLQRLARSHNIDLTLLRENTGKLLGKSIQHPLKICPELLLVPVKVRKPKIAGDPSTGYINYFAVKDLNTLRNSPSGSAVRLFSGQTISILWSPSTLKRSMKQAEMLLSPRPQEQREVDSIARKLVEVIYEILTLKRS